MSEREVRIGKHGPERREALRARVEVLRGPDDEGERGGDEGEEELRAYYGDAVPAGYVVVEWPWSQGYMDAPWFREEALLINGETLVERHGGSAYLVPAGRHAAA